MPSLTSTRSDSHTVVDREQRVIAFMLGAPAGDPTWKDVGPSANSAMEEAEKECQFPPSNPKNGRGNYPVLSTGFSWGGGPPKPSNIPNNNKTHQRVLSRLVLHRSFGRISGHTNAGVSTGAPRMYRHLDEVLGDIRKNDPSLRKPFSNSVFPVATFNFGPSATTVPHRDSRNVPYGWCAVTALGNFDYKRGGHLILWDLKILIEFPPGSTILLPSSVVTHSNTCIQPGETRRSFTQHCAGSLVRWWMHGFRTEAAMQSEDPMLAEKVRSAAGGRWKEALNYFSKWPALAKDMATL
ncbi:hypothetical protein FA95DRAFT_1503572 [Auriscalpium vulgare]|uniref:Uncharacterized protein n=1 Tax=Auriscalpium vulgare TaxID=40419 RepID=A0ACB8R718_9AGAM|nr:hypothetical protein FA95DRAFT_1503572 [Auriscalpium vulgare]